MTLAEMKKKVLKMIEEYTDNEVFTSDPDIQVKMNDIVNQVMFELSRVKKIPEYTEMQAAEGDIIRFADIDSENEVYQLGVVRGIDCELKADNTIIKCFEEGTLEIEYYKYPKRITEENADTYEFELSNDVLEVMPYGVAADLLKSDVSNAYGDVYAKRYEQMKQQMDIRYSTGFITFEGGL